jgi:two-component system sensor histidine kinase ChiS
MNTSSAAAAAGDVATGNEGAEGGWGMSDSAETTSRGAELPTNGPAPLVLIVEDDPDSAELMAQILEIEGYRVRKSPSGLDALNPETFDGVDLMLLDVMLPGVDGFEVCHRLRREPTTARLPIVMVSAKGRREDIETGLRVGANVYMTKPLSRSELTATVKKLLAEARMEV